MREITTAAILLKTAEVLLKTRIAAAFEAATAPALPALAAELSAAP